MKMENVTCSWVSETPSCAVHGFVNSVHTYCGLEMAIMQISPRVSCIHLLPKNPVVRVDCAKAIFMIDHSLEWKWNLTVGCATTNYPATRRCRRPPCLEPNACGLLGFGAAACRVHNRRQ